MKSIVLIGSGNLASNLGNILQQKGYHIKQIYSRTLSNAKKLAETLLVDNVTNEIDSLVADADIYIFSVKDDILSSLVCSVPSNKGIWIHTAGSMPMDVFDGKIKNFGVLYPLQTFSKNRAVDWADIPLFIEGNNIDTVNTIKDMAQDISPKVYELSSEKRKYIHLSAVFSCNFVNYMYLLGNKYLNNTEMSFDVLLPLINETARKVNTLMPKDAQTGPAIRFDRFVIDKHLSLIEDIEDQKIYKQMTNAIHNKFKK